MPSMVKPTRKTHVGATNMFDVAVSRNGAPSRAIGSREFRES
jgi:hypothetical protein